MSSYNGVVLITVDSLRADHMGYFGYERDTSPFLDRFAQSNRSFTNAVSAGPDTSTSFPALLSSDYYSSFQESRENRLAEDRLLIAQVLPDDVDSAAFHSNPFISSFYGFDRDFDHFEDYLITESTVNAGPWGKVKRVIDMVRGRPPFTSGEEINRDSLNWISSVNGPFFLWNHYMEPHMPYLPPKGYMSKVDAEKVGHLKRLMLGRALDRGGASGIKEKDVRRLVDLYDACIRHLDDIIRDLITRLPDNTAVIFTSDHGEGFREHGFLAHPARLYEENIHVPLYVSGESKKVERPVSHLDIVPTVLDLLGLKIPESYVGRSLRSPPDREGVFSEAGGKGQWLTSYRTPRWKYIKDDRRNEEGLFDLKHDPGEKKNLVDSEKVSYFKRKVEEHRERQKEKKSEREKGKIADKVKGLSI